MILVKEEDKARFVIVSKEEEDEAGSAAMAKEDNEAKIVIVMKEDDGKAGFASVSGAPAPCRATISAPVPPSTSRSSRLSIPSAPGAPGSNARRRLCAASTLFPAVSPVAGDMVHVVPYLLLGPRCLGDEAHPALVVGGHLVVKEGHHTCRG